MILSESEKHKKGVTLANRHFVFVDKARYRLLISV